MLLSPPGILDAKVSLVAYADSSAAEDDDSRAAAAMKHVSAVRAQVKDLSEQNYPSAKGVDSPDFVLMFMLIESAYVAAVSEDKSLWTESAAKNVIICSPSTLIPIAQTIANIWGSARQNENVKAIADRGARLYDKFAGFVSSMEEVDGALRKSRESSDKALGQLKTGRGNLIGQANKLLDLGIKPKSGRLPEE